MDGKIWYRLVKTKIIWVYFMTINLNKAVDKKFILFLYFNKYINNIKHNKT